ncbi:MAG: ribonuclease HI [Planctomycetota bacterium]|nr:ribonuclease HI [Planctomycetota bacterium]
MHGSKTGSKPKVEIFTDGGCDPNPGPGGWAAILKCPAMGLEKEISGAENDTTNNRMELTAVIEALSALKVPCEVTIVTDSRYLADAFKARWIEKWKRNGWKTAAKTPVKNQDLWMRLDELCRRHSVEWVWTEGHAGHPENERCDRMVREARERRSAGDARGRDRH